MRLGSLIDLNLSGEHGDASDTTEAACDHGKPIRLFPFPMAMADRGFCEKFFISIMSICPKGSFMAAGMAVADLSLFYFGYIRLREYI
ncbi:hypothetical protein ATDW_34950 (plasmid) [Asticcacaulis sp. DW145]|uniref:hypothetical protein n=1 Tax=Asticcacaulis sp. DW145 TaxID=3095608 RepID=UPI00308E1B83|nr:hypothetical protein ATDW_34950 [Asticcacaulis sp. DW145]